jgi:hypothetical protein
MFLRYVLQPRVRAKEHIGSAKYRGVRVGGLPGPGIVVFRR